MVKHDKELARLAELRKEREQEAIERRYDDDEMDAMSRHMDPEEPVGWEP